MNQMKAKIIGLLTIPLWIGITSCENGQNFPDEPYLEYRSYRLVDADQDPVFPIDHAIVDLYFTDGDGDIGLETPPPGQFNFNVSVFEKADTGGYIYAYDWSGILSDLSDPGQQNKVLEGVISYKVGLGDIISDTAYIEFELVDDAGNSSGIVTSEKIYVNF